MAETVTKTTTEEFERWVIKEGFEIGQKAMAQAGGRFGAPILIGLSDDLATHHANGLIFWSSANKDESMRMVRDIVRSQKHVAAALLIKSEVRKEGKARPTMALVVRSKGKPARMFIREILPDGLGPVEEYADAEGRLTQFWEDSPVVAP